MICYRDMTFCRARCLTINCERHSRFIAAAKPDMPVAWSDFSDSCKDYVKDQCRQPNNCKFPDCGCEP